MDYDRHEQPTAQSPHAARPSGVVPANRSFQLTATLAILVLSALLAVGLWLFTGNMIGNRQTVIDPGTTPTVENDIVPAREERAVPANASPVPNPE